MKITQSSVCTGGNCSYVLSLPILAAYGAYKKWASAIIIIGVEIMWNH